MTSGHAVAMSPVLVVIVCYDNYKQIFVYLVSANDMLYKCSKEIRRLQLPSIQCKNC